MFMSNVFTVTTELKLNKEYNQLVSKYISDYIGLFNKIKIPIIIFQIDSL